MENIIECRSLTHYYGRRMIYKDLSFNVPKGRILGLLGKNGTGKTTTINILSGYLEPKSGECLIFGEHVQYQFMTIREIERFYSAFYPSWKKEAYYELMGKLKVAPGQRISRMSCGQRSQVALGLILAQNPDLLVLDDFSLGLDPGYRRLFSDYLREYAKAEGKTVFLTSHIIQDMERLVDDCIIMDYGSILLQCPINDILGKFRIYACHADRLPENTGEQLFHPSLIKGTLEFGSFLGKEEIELILAENGIAHSGLHCTEATLEDTFISMTGKY